MGWPQDGTFNLDCILQVKDRVFDAGLHGHPEQVLYVITWESLVLDPPPWVAPFVTMKPRVPKATAMGPTAPPAQSSLYPLLETEKLDTRPNPVLPPEDLVLNDLLSEEPPPYQAPPRSAPLLAGPPPTSDEVRSPDTTSLVVDEGTSAPFPVASQLCLRRNQREGETGEWKAQAFSLRTVGGPGNQGHYWPFSASNLYNWKTHNPPFSKAPLACTGLIESILLTHQLTWDDCQQLLQALLTTEERHPRSQEEHAWA